MKKKDVRDAALKQAQTKITTAKNGLESIRLLAQVGRLDKPEIKQLVEPLETLQKDAMKTIVILSIRIQK